MVHNLGRPGKYYVFLLLNYKLKCLLNAHLVYISSMISFLRCNSSVMAAISDAPSKILEVPREIRDIIYGNFIKNHHESVVVSRERGFTIDTPHMANLHLNKWCRNTSLMFVNHQIKEEYEDAVYRETAFLIHKPVAEWFFMEAKWHFWPVLQLDAVPDYVKSRLRRLELHLSISEKMMQKRTILTRTRTDMDAQMIYVIEECISRLPALESLTVLVDYCEDGVSRVPRHLHCGFSESRFLEYTPSSNTSLRIYKAAFHRDFPYYWQHSGKVSVKDSTGTFHVKDQSAFDRQFL